jgi:4-amino-4-deoxy-L-arabinose transferase-like glycosyltransferase
MLENYAWGQTLIWGTFKHPPLFAWMTGLWFRIFPTGDIAYLALSYVNVAIGLLGIYRLAVAMRLRAAALPSVILICMSFPYSTLAAKFNANSVLLSVWPWLVVAWWRCMQGNTPPWRSAVALGGLAALAMLGKYYSGVLLLALLLIGLSQPAGRRWLSSWPAALALTVFLVCMAPHLIWSWRHDFPSLRYLGEQGGGQIGWEQLWRFALAPILWWGLPWLLCASLFGQASQKWGGRLLQCWKPCGWSDPLFWVALLPWLITLGFGIAGLVELSLPWAIPVGFAFPLLWIRNLQHEAPSQHSEDRLEPGSRRLLKIYGGASPVLLSAALLVGWNSAARGNDEFYLPRVEAAKAILQTWQRQHPGQRLQWVGGSWAENALVAFYGDPTLRVIPGVPDQFPATLDPPKNWSNRPGLFVCAPSPRDPTAQADCDQGTQTWLREHDRKTEPTVITVTRQGFRFPLYEDHPFTYHLYAYLPD